MNVVTALNEKYVPYTYVMLYSLFQNNKEKTCVFLLQDDLMEISKDRLKDLCHRYQNEAYFVEMNRDMFDKRLLTTDDWSMETCFRLAMNDVLPRDLDRVIYLDGDMIINKDISELYHMDFPEGKHLIATHDMTMTPDSEPVYGKLHTEVFNRLIRENKYFNAGMIVMDFANLHTRYGFSEYLKKAKELEFKIFAPDQDLLNLLHEDEVEFVDEWKYDLFACNAFIRQYDYKRVKDEVSIIHFVGEKPWRGGSHFHFDVENLWWDYALHTVYKEFFLNEFVSHVFSDSPFYQAIEQAEQMNRQLSGNRASGRPVFDVPKKGEEESFVRMVLSDKQTEQYVSDLYAENERLQRMMQEALKQMEELMKKMN